jgi:hypothetical protein
MERVKRQRRAPVRYWDEFVATDKWYLRELVADIPPEEMKAAVEDSDFSESDCDFPNEGNDTDGEYEQRDGGSEEGEDTESIQWSSEGERGGEETDGESESSTVGEEWVAADE